MKGGIEKLSFEEIEKQADNRIDLDKLPEIIKATAIKAIWEKDNMERNCLIVEYKTSKGNFTQKYTPMHLNELKYAMKKLGIKNLLEAGELTLRKTVFRIGFPRMIPAA